MSAPSTLQAGHENGRTGRLIIHKSPSFMNRKTMLMLDFIVIGGGIAGLACAYALGKAGHRVRVLEKSPSGTRSSGGIRVPPNLTKILVEWGLEDELRRVAQRCRSSTLYCKTGKAVGYHEWSDDVLHETGADFLLMHHEDLHRMLTQLALSVGVKISYSSPVTAVYPPSSPTSSQKVRVEVSRHEQLVADVVVAADGGDSTIRKMVIEELEEVDSGMSVFTAIIPAETVRGDPDPILAKIPDRPEWPIWIGSSRSVLAYPIRGASEVAVHFFAPNADTNSPGDSGAGDDEWASKCALNAANLGDCEPGIKRLLGMASSSSRTRYIKRTHPEDWADESARIVLIGEAAHPFPPCSMHNCSLAVEDAAVFGALFSRLRSPDQIQVLMEAFQELRQPRCLMAHRAEIANTALLWLPPGQERDARDKKMRKAMLENGKEPDEGRLRQQWEQFGVMFAYCAGEEAEDWWHRWGVLTESSRAMKPLDSLHLKLEVTRVMEAHGDVSKGYYGS